MTVPRFDMNPESKPIGAIVGINALFMAASALNQETIGLVGFGISTIGTALVGVYFVYRSGQQKLEATDDKATITTLEGRLGTANNEITLLKQQVDHLLKEIDVWRSLSRASRLAPDEPKQPDQTTSVDTSA